MFRVSDFGILCILIIASYTVISDIVNYNRKCVLVSVPNIVGF